MIGRAAPLLVVLAACGGKDPPPVVVAPVTLDVPPMVTVSTSAVASVPPPNSERYLQPEPIPLGPAPVRAPDPNPLAPRSTASFDRQAAAVVLGQLNYQVCAQPGGPSGPGHVTVTFDPSGVAASTSVDSPPFAGTSTGACIAAAFGTARIPPFGGAPVRIGKSFILP